MNKNIITSRPVVAIAFSAGLLTLAACSFGPTGDPLSMLPPAHYGALPQPSQTVSAKGETQRFAVGAKPVPQWWTLYRSAQLDALVDEGLCNSPTLAAANSSLAAARELLRAQIGNSLPSIDAGGQAIRGAAPAVPRLGADAFQYNVFVGQVQAEYKFDLFGAMRLENAALAARTNVQRYQLDAARRTLAANIVSAALRAATVRAQVDTTSRLIFLANEQVRELMRRHELGAVSRADVLSAQQSAETAAVNLPTLRLELIRTRHALAVLIGRTPDAAPPDIDLAQLHLPVTLPVSIPSDLLRARPDIQASAAALKAAAADVGVATAQLFPSLSLTASMGRSHFDGPLGLLGAGALWSLGASLSQPIFHGGALLAKRRSAMNLYDAAKEQYKQAVLSAFQNVADTLASIEQDAEALDAANRAVIAAQGQFDDSSARYKLGAVSSFSVRSAELQLHQVQLDEIRYIGARFADTATLFQAMGNPEPASSTIAPAVNHIDEINCMAPCQPLACISPCTKQDSVADLVPL